jgi:hypothetical protein
VTVELALARYLAKCERSQRSEGTMNQYVSKAKHLLRVLGGERSINELRLSHIEQYIDARLIEIKRIRPDSTRSIATVGKELGLLRSALRYMAKQRGPDGFKLYRYDTDEIFPEGVIGQLQAARSCAVDRRVPGHLLRAAGGAARVLASVLRSRHARLGAVSHHADRHRSARTRRAHPGNEDRGRRALAASA